MVQSPHDMPAAFAAAFNRKDVDALLALYSERPLGWRYVIDAPFGIKV